MPPVAQTSAGRHLFSILVLATLATLKGVQGAGGKADTKLVVVARYREDTSWLDVSSGDTPHVVYTAGDPLSGRSPPENRGNEAASYLSAIIDLYDDLPDSVLFLHGHRRGWHDKLAPSDWVVRYLQWPIEHPFVAVQCPWVNTDDPWLRPRDPESARRSLDPRRSKAVLRSRQFSDAWSLLFEHHFGPMPAKASACVCDVSLLRIAA